MTWSADISEISRFIRRALRLNPPLSPYGAWYQRYLKQHMIFLHGRIQSLSKTHLNHGQSDNEILETLGAIVELIHTERNIPLAEVRDLLYAQPLLRSLNLSEEEHLELSRYLLALVTMFFEPHRTLLERSIVGPDAHATSNPFPGSQLTEMQEHHRSIATQAFKNILRRQNRLQIPIYPCPQPQLPHSATVSTAYSADSSSLRAPNFHYSNLLTFARITVEWSPSMALHLHFDATTKTLYLLKYSSFCAMACESTQTTSIVEDSSASFDLDRYGKILYYHHC